MVDPDRLPGVGHPGDVPTCAGCVRGRRIDAREHPPTAPGPDLPEAARGPLEAALSSVQVSERADLSPTQVVERLGAVAPKTVRGRTRTPALIRNHATMAVDGPVHETWKLGYLIDTIYLRDLWMHRVDAARALGRPVELTTDHDGRIVADVVAEWARRHGQPFVLELTGPVGATYVSHPETPGGAHVSLDAIEFCRTLAGRAPATGLLATIVPF